MRMGSIASGAVLLGLVACGGEEAAPPAAKPAAPAAPVVGGRTIADEARTAMRNALSAATTGKKAWFMAQPGNDEVAQLLLSLAAVFKEAGWEVFAEPVAGISLKPGVMTLVAEEEYPSYVDAALKAMEASGLDAKSASGYRSYYESKKQENAAWPGVPLKAGQDFVIVVGPKPAA
jgi:nucleotide-binding universal stress UspA family protein